LMFEQLVFPHVVWSTTNREFLLIVEEEICCAKADGAIKVEANTPTRATNTYFQLKFIIYSIIAINYKRFTRQS
jgi:hypothetical protein